MQAAKLLATRRPRHRDESVDRARGADCADDAGALCLAHQRADHALEMRLELAQLRTRGRVVKQETLGQARGAELDAAHPQRLAVAHQHQFHAAAADVDQQMRASLETESMTGSLKNEA